MEEFHFINGQEVEITSNMRTFHDESKPLQEFVDVSKIRPKSPAENVRMFQVEEEVDGTGVKPQDRVPSLQNQGVVESPTPIGGSAIESPNPIGGTALSIERAIQPSPSSIQDNLKKLPSSSNNLSLERDKPSLTQIKFQRKRKIKITTPNRNTEISQSHKKLKKTKATNAPTSMEACHARGTSLGSSADEEVQHGLIRAVAKGKRSKSHCKGGRVPNLLNILPVPLKEGHIGDDHVSSSFHKEKAKDVLKHSVVIGLPTPEAKCPKKQPSAPPSALMKGPIGGIEIKQRRVRRTEKKMVNVSTTRRDQSKETNSSRRTSTKGPEHGASSREILDIIPTEGAESLNQTGKEHPPVSRRKFRPVVADSSSKISVKGKDHKRSARGKPKALASTVNLVTEGTTRGPYSRDIMSTTVQTECADGIAEKHLPLSSRKRRSKVADSSRKTSIKGKKLKISAHGRPEDLAFGINLLTEGPEHQQASCEETMADIVRRNCAKLLNYSAEEHPPLSEWLTKYAAPLVEENRGISPQNQFMLNEAISEGQNAKGDEHTFSDECNNGRRDEQNETALRSSVVDATANTFSSSPSQGDEGNPPQTLPFIPVECVELADHNTEEHLHLSLSLETSNSPAIEENTGVLPESCVMPDEAITRRDEEAVPQSLPFIPIECAELLNHSAEEHVLLSEVPKKPNSSPREENIGVLRAIRVMPDEAITRRDEEAVPQSLYFIPIECADLLNHSAEEHVLLSEVPKKSNSSPREENIGVSPEIRVMPDEAISGRDGLMEVHELENSLPMVNSYSSDKQTISDEYNDTRGAKKTETAPQTIVVDATGSTCSSSPRLGNEVVVPASLPSIKSLPLWESIDSMGAFNSIPQQPHFHRLEQHKEDLREGMALSYMLSFANLVDGTCTTQLGELQKTIIQMKEKLQSATMEKDIKGSNVAEFKMTIDEVRQRIQAVKLDFDRILAAPW